jgi:FKBP-type peptidyl-prolyl cis-trans isomerase
VKEGGRVILLIPAYKAYGDEGFRDLVAPAQHLLFDVEVLAKIK